MIDFSRALTRNDVRAVGAIGFVAGAVAGVAGGYIVAKKRLQTVYSDLANKEIASVKELYMRRNKEGAYSTPAEAAAVLITEDDDAIAVAPELNPEARDIALAALEQYNSTVAPAPGKKIRVDYNAITKADASAAVQSVTSVKPAVSERVEQNIFDQQDDDAPGLFGPRDPDRPYIIMPEEFFDDDNNRSQITITYYDGDDTLSDDADQIIQDVDKVVGQNNLDAFINGLSPQNREDKQTLYVRNEKMDADFEIVWEPGAYSVIVLGMRPEELVTSEPMRSRHSRSRDDG